MMTKIKKLLCLTPNPIHGASDRFRIYQFVPYLERGGYSTTVRAFATETLFRAIQTRGRSSLKALQAAYCTARRVLDIASVQSYDLVLINREAFPFLTPVFERLIVWRQPRVVFNFDDAIYVGHQDTSNLAHPFLYKFKHTSKISEVLKRSTLVIAGCETLANYARQYNSRVTLIPTPVDLGDYTFAPHKVEPGEPITIGWWGSRSTSPYLSVVTRALQQIAAAHGDRVRFVFYGDKEYSADLPNARVVPFSLDTEVEELGKIDIGIMPMPDTPWTRGKCALKAIQYMARGIPAVVSPIGMSADVVQHGVNGFWASNEEEWFTYLSQLITDVDLRRRFSIRGRETVEQRYSLQVWGPRMPALLDGILTEPLPTGPVRTVPSRAS